MIERAKDLKQCESSNNIKVQEGIEVQAIFNHQVAIQMKLQESGNEINEVSSERNDIGLNNVKEKNEQIKPTKTASFGILTEYNNLEDNKVDKC